MPPKKSLRRAVIQPRRNICKTCNNLSPRDHASSVYLTERTKGALARLSLVLDAFELSRSRLPKEGGCRFCNVLCQALDALFGDWRGTRQRVNVDIKEKGTIKVGLDQEAWRGEVVSIYTTKRKSSRSWSTLGTARRIPLNSGSDDTFDFARRSIQDCLTNPKHGACILPRNSSASTPKRLLDVGRATAPIRLIDTQGRALEYAALSHCWGTGSPLKTTKANWRVLSHDIPFNSLPPLFQDAIVITRQMGLRYIWIDSLCIIQDSARDWETESFKMGSIYENAYFTISATASPDGASRALKDREKPVKLNFENLGGDELEIRARRVEDHHPSNKEDPATLVGPLTTRAWALQEHFLSTRILHYTKTELLFECRTSFRCECSPSRKSLPTTPALIPKATAKLNRDPKAVWDAWHRVVEQYSRRNLTHLNDKLPAISGIAGQIQKATSSRYIAGLWEANLAWDLLWSTTTTAADAQYFSPDKYRAPSFSWASLDTPVAFAPLDQEERLSVVSSITLVSSSVSVTGLNPLGTLSDASIHVRGPIMHATLLSTQRGGIWEYVLFLKGSSAITIQKDCLLVEDVIGGSSSGRAQTVRRAQCGDAPQDFKASVLCLCVARHDTWISGLVLGLARQDPDYWNRLGTFAAGSDVFQRAQEKELHVT
ncbi:HET-domain-containing protein [Karstenula rhodostoma CBS 690.94]|uniref:HET-domain-containing protein n=1 Tax=Karstenula rhodostoma CBS 690.94 TaxID=1392251 RepID=A0A9P4PDZ5_9PLEO|nr:HET-domain-containing protein [Karstenula rhodostoma CBS 690.94]